MHIAIVDSALSENASAYCAGSPKSWKPPPGGPPALPTTMSTPPSASRAARTNPAAPSGVETSASIATTCGRGGQPVRIAAADRDCDTFGEKRVGNGEPQTRARRGHGGAPTGDAE